VIDDGTVPWLPCDRCGWMPVSCTCSPHQNAGKARHAAHCRCKSCTSDRRWAEAERAERARVRAQLTWWPAA
jgi:hypothetical protein